MEPRSSPFLLGKPPTQTRWMGELRKQSRTCSCRACGPLLRRQGGRQVQKPPPGALHSPTSRLTSSWPHLLRVWTTTILRLLWREKRNGQECLCPPVLYVPPIQSARPPIQLAGSARSCMVQEFVTIRLRSHGCPLGVLYRLWPCMGESHTSPSSAFSWLAGYPTLLAHARTPRNNVACSGVSRGVGRPQRRSVGVGRDKIRKAEAHERHSRTRRKSKIPRISSGHPTYFFFSFPTLVLVQFLGAEVYVLSLKSGEICPV